MLRNIFSLVKKSTCDDYSDRLFVFLTKDDYICSSF